MVADPATSGAATPDPAPRVALVLGAGGARGYAHIGVIQALEASGADIVAVSGCSMGAIIGGLYAADALDEFTDWAMDLGGMEMLRLLDVSLRKGGAVSVDKVFEHVAGLTGGAHIEDLRIPFTAVAVDVLSRREVWFQRGPLDLALRASAAIPSVFTPAVIDSRVLVDGGVLNPLPLAPVSATRADRVVAVSLSGRDPGDRAPIHDAGGPDADVESIPVAESRSAAARWFDEQVLSSVKALLGNDDADASTDPRSGKPQPDGVELGAFDVAQLSYDLMQEALIRTHLAVYSPDLLISIPKSAARTLEFHRAEELIDLGRQLAEDALSR